MNEWIALFIGFVFGLLAIMPFIVMAFSFPTTKPETFQPYMPNEANQRALKSGNHIPRVVVFDPDGVPVLKMD